MTLIKNSQGKIFYGMHFYPGVAEYQEPGKDPYRIFINEDTIRKMDPSFAGRPVFVQHVDEVEEDINQLRGEADGWVIESFYNQADGKHWVKFISVSDKADRAIQRGFRLSNAYVPKNFGPGNVWNGVSYAKEITDGEFEHLALVEDPRYEESVIMTPEEFKAYNNEKEVELKRLKNSRETSSNKGESKMGLNLFKRTKIENDKAIDLETTMVELPKSKKEMTLAAVINELDAIKNMHGYANGDHLVKVGDKDEMSVNDLVKKHMEMCNKMSEMETKNAGGAEGEDADIDSMDNAEESDASKIATSDVGDRGGDKSLDNEEDEEKKKAEKKAGEEKKKNAKAKADALRNAHLRNDLDEVAVVELSEDKVARGKARYGS